MQFTSFTLVAAASAAFVSVANADFSDDQGQGILWSATQPNSGNAQICVTATVTTSQWVALGIPADPKNPVMAGADLYLLYTDVTNLAAPIVLLHGSGNHVFNPLGSGVTDNVATLASSSTYANKQLTACFLRPLNAPQSLIVGSTAVVPRNITTGSSTYLWAVGPMQGKTPGQHTFRGSITGSLFTGSATTSSTVNSTTTSSKTGGAAGLKDSYLRLAVGVVMAALVAVVF